jgi:hypothetical protein
LRLLLGGCGGKSFLLIGKDRLEIFPVTRLQPRPIAKTFAALQVADRSRTFAHRGAQQLHAQDGVQEGALAGLLSFHRREKLTAVDSHHQRAVVRLDGEEQAGEVQTSDEGQGRGDNGPDCKLREAVLPRGRCCRRGGSFNRLSPAPAWNATGTTNVINGHKYT